MTEQQIALAEDALANAENAYRENSTQANLIRLLSAEAKLNGLLRKLAKQKEEKGEKGEEE